MTNLLDEAVKQISQLSDLEQDEIAKMILDELNWKKSFLTSQTQLGIMADEALRDYKEGKTTPLEF